MLRFQFASSTNRIIVGSHSFFLKQDKCHLSQLLRCMETRWMCDLKARGRSFELQESLWLGVKMKRAAAISEINTRNVSPESQYDHIDGEGMSRFKRQQKWPPVSWLLTGREDRARCGGPDLTPRCSSCHYEQFQVSLCAFGSCDQNIQQLTEEAAEWLYKTINKLIITWTRGFSWSRWSKRHF